MPSNLPPQLRPRQHEITATFLKEVDKHLLDIVEGRTDEMLEIRDFAKIMYINSSHLSDTIKLVTGQSPCYFFEEKILAIAKGMLEKNELSIGDIATLLTYDPSNFTKFFKAFTQQTPKQYRESYLAAQISLKTETLTI